MGVREDEICGRLVGDIEWIDTEIGPVAYLKIRDSKTASSSRDVPIHKLILELGFIEYRYYGRAAKEPLFPELIPQGVEPRRSGAFSGRFTGYRKKIKIMRPGVDFRSYRGNVETSLRNTDGVNAGWIDELIGHDSPVRRSEGARYTKSIFMANLKRTVDKVVIGVDLSTLYHSGPRGVQAAGSADDIAVEEQFYILWPLLLIAVQRRKGSPLQAARVVCFLSFVFNAVLITLDRTATFYSPLTRFWELMFGSIMAIELLAGPQDTLSALARYRLGMSEQTLRHVVSVFGAILVVIGLAVIDSNRRLPGYWALIPTMAAVYLICAGPTALLNRRLLSLPALVHIGLISYPLYLWHWPLLSFAHFISSGEPDWTVKGACIALSFLLAECTYQMLEKPIRSGGWRGRKTAVAVGSLVAIGAVGLAIFALDGLPSRFNAALQNVIRDHKPLALAAYSQHGCFLGDGDDVLSFSQRCEGAAEGGTRTVLVWGDSHAAHLLPGINHALPKGLRLAEYTTSGCPPLQAYVSSRKNCAAINEFVMSKIEQLKPDTVILAGFWHAYYAAGDQNVITSRIHDVIVRLKAMGVNHVVGVGQFPIWLTPPANTLRHIYDRTLVGTVGRA